MQVQFDPPAGPIGALVACPECGNMFRKGHPGHTYCTRRCRRKPEARRKAERDNGVVKPLRTSEERKDVIWGPTAEVLVLHANILLALKDGERGYTFGGEALDKVALPAGVGLFPAYGMEKVWNMRLADAQVGPMPQAVLKPKRSVMDIMRDAKAGKVLPTEGT